MAVGRGFQHSSGRIIGVGRLLQACLFLLAIAVDDTQPAPPAIYALLGLYVAWAAAVAATTWRNWWIDAKLAGPAHAVDIAMFLVLSVATAGYTGPLFALFVFLLLAAAIRWSWRATALTAALLIMLYLIAGIVLTPPGDMLETDPFLVGTGHLMMFSLILIWFGALQWHTRYNRPDRGAVIAVPLDDLPLEAALRDAMNAARAGRGIFLWRGEQSGEYAGVAIDGEVTTKVALPARGLARAVALQPFVYAYADDRALKRDEKRNLTAFPPHDAIPRPAATRLDLADGLAVPVRTDEGEGAIFLERVAGLSTDHIDLGDQIAADVAAHMQRHALLKWADENAEARSRLSLARDLHDSIVQFLAGAAFRLEAMKRSQATGGAIEADIDELKQLMLAEQRELRGFIEAVRRGSSVPYGELARDLQELADRLAQQWDVACKLSAAPAELMIPARFHHYAHQLMREAVANAVRHAQAKSVRVELSVADDSMRLKFINDGAAFRARRGKPAMPASLQERVEQAGGTIDLSRGMDLTKIVIALPLGGGRQ